MYELVIVEKMISAKTQWVLGLLIPNCVPMGQPHSDDRVLMVISRYATREEAVEAMTTMLNDLIYQHLPK